MLHPFGLIFLAMPVVLAVLIGVVGWLLYRHGPRWSFLLAPVLVLGPPLSDRVHSTGEFHKACHAAASGQVVKRVQADGFLLESVHAGDFGTSHLLEGFRWIERRSRSGGWERVSANPDGSVSVQTIDEPTARYMVVETTDQARSWKRFTRRIVDRQDATTLATSGYAVYLGGTVTWMLAPFDHDDCAWVPGGSRFNQYFQLTKYVLQPSAPEAGPKP